MQSIQQHCAASVTSPPRRFPQFRPELRTEAVELPEGQWRSSAAVKGEWNGDGAFVEYQAPTGGMKVWSGSAAPQMSSDGVNVLSGGGNQIWIPPGSTLAGTPISTGFIK